MSSATLNKTDSESIWLSFNEVQKLVVNIRSSPAMNSSIDITVLNNNEDADRPDALRVPEVIIVICVLLLWCASIFIFIRHSELLRIRHRDLPYRSSLKPPMNLNHITVVHRTSDMVIHAKPRYSFTTSTTPPAHSLPMEEYRNNEATTISNPYVSKQDQHAYSIGSSASLPKTRYRDEQFLDPYMISTDVRRSLLNLHRKSIGNLSAMRYSMSYSTNDISQRKHSDDQQVTMEERCIQESPV